MIIPDLILNDLPAEVVREIEAWKEINADYDVKVIDVMSNGNVEVFLVTPDKRARIIRYYHQDRSITCDAVNWLDVGILNQLFNN